MFFPACIWAIADDLGREPQLVHVIFVIVGAEGGFFSHRVGVGELPRARLYASSGGAAAVRGRSAADASHGRVQTGHGSRLQRMVMKVEPYGRLHARSNAPLPSPRWAKEGEEEEEGRRRRRRRRSNVFTAHLKWSV